MRKKTQRNSFNKKRIQIEYFLKRIIQRKRMIPPGGIGGEKKNKGTNNPNHRENLS